MKTLDKIKRDIVTCMELNKEKFTPGSTQKALSDALSCIQQLEKSLSFARDLADGLKTATVKQEQEIYKLKAERDAAVRDMTEIVQNSGDSYCEYCKNWKPGTCPPYCRTHSEGFRWRGVQKEE